MVPAPSPSPNPWLNRRNLASVLAHLGLFTVSLLVAFVLAYNFAGVQQWFFPQFMMALPVFLLVKYAIFAALRQHQRSWRYVGPGDLFSAAAAGALATAILASGMIAVRTLATWSAVAGIVRFPSSVLLIDWVLSVVALSCGRLLIRYYFEQGRRCGAKGQRKLIVGAGDAGETLLREIQRGNIARHDVVGFLDDDPRKLGTRIHGVPVLAAIAMVKHICTVHQIEEVLIAIPSAPHQRIREIVELCEGAHVGFRIVPGLAELIEGSITIESQLRQIKVEDLLERSPVVLDHAAISDYLRGKKVLVTGAGGTIGKELCRQIMTFKPESLVLVEISENHFFETQRELQARPAGLRMACYLGDVCDRRRMAAIFKREQPDIVCHAAAHKHVPMLEAHPGEGLKNNILGTRTLADLAVECHVRKFVYISTDKAVNPTSIMGCTKRIAEMYIQGLSERTVTQFITVRFGNVLGSSGSVLPIFQEQIRSGGPLTVTHPDITRYFMTIPEAAQLVLQAGALGRGGEIFLLEMGAPVRIVDLARNLIILSGLTPGVDIEIAYTGLRPGEKLFEELYISGEGLTPTTHPRIRVWRHRPENWRTLTAAIPALLALADCDDTPRIKKRLAELVPEYDPDYSPDRSTSKPVPTAASQEAGANLRTLSASEA